MTRVYGLAAIALFAIFEDDKIVARETVAERGISPRADARRSLVEWI